MGNETMSNGGEEEMIEQENRKGVITEEDEKE